MKNCWRFNTLRKTDKVREPIQGEFFASEETSDPGSALIREGIQNSLDAKSQIETKVMVRICISSNKAAIEREAVSSLMLGLTEHLQAPKNGLTEIPEENEKCKFLVFEDFGTTGLIGNPKEYDPPEGSKNDFFHFFRAEGKSEKGENDRGRWGVGKQVFPRASRINSIFGLTVRETDSHKYLMGMAVLKSHHVDGVRYAPDGWFGNVPESDEELVLPIDDKSTVDSFIETFNLDRKEENGLSIVIPWCDVELNDENLICAVLKDYFWPILKRKLDVIVETDGIETCLDASTLETEVEKIGGVLERDILPKIRLAKWAASLEENEHTELNPPAPNKAWEWEGSMFQEGAIDTLRVQLEHGDRLALSVPVTVREKGKHPRDTHFNIYLERDSSENVGRPVFIREGIIIPDVRSPRTRGIRALVVAEDGPIASFLGDAENPAHTQWQKEGTNFRGKYVSGASDLKFVAQSVYEINRFLLEQDKDEDRMLLSNIFSLPAQMVEDPSRKHKNKSGRKPGNNIDKPNPPPPRPKPFYFDQIGDGFVIRNNKASTEHPSYLQVRAAYHVRRSNPFRKYNPADFDFQVSLDTHLTGVQEIHKDQNLLIVRIVEREFEIIVEGFDTNRDLRVDVRPLEDSDVNSYI